MLCSICEDSNEVIHFPHFYITGSEGCNLCLSCRLVLTQQIRDMRNLVAKTKKGFYKQRNRKNV